MKFKQIQPGDSIRCRTKREAVTLLAELDRLGYIWRGGSKITRRESCIQRYEENTVYHVFECLCLDKVKRKLVGIMPTKAWDEPEFQTEYWKPYVEFSSLLISD